MISTSLDKMLKTFNCENYIRYIPAYFYVNIV